MSYINKEIIMKEQTEIVAREYWLNPSRLKDGVFQVHVNYIFKNGGSKFYTISPDNLMIYEKMVYAPDRLTDEEKAIINPKTIVDKLKGQIGDFKNQQDRVKEQLKKDLILLKDEIETEKKKKEAAKAIERAGQQIERLQKQIKNLKEEADLNKKLAKNGKKRKTFVGYVGDERINRAIAYGITAFFIKKGPHDDSPTSSLLSMLQRGKRLAIYSWYEEYYENQVAAGREINEAKTEAQGRLTPGQLTDTFNRNHLELEQRYYKKSEGFFKMIHDEGEQAAKVMREYVEGYLVWIDEKTNSTTVIFPTNYNEAHLKKIGDGLVSYNLIAKKEKSKFVSLFSDKPQSITWNDKILGSMPALFNLMDKITEKKTQAKDLKPFIKTASGKNIHDNMAHKNRAKVKMVCEILKGL